MDDAQKEEIISLIKTEKPLLKDTSIAQYVRTLNTLYKKLKSEGEEYNYMELFKNAGKVKDALSEYHFTTARNFYTSLITILSTEVAPDKKIILQYEGIVKSNNEQYDKQNQSGIISVKQSGNFVGVEKIDELIMKLKKDEIHMAYILFSILKYHHIRNEIATLEQIALKSYNKLTTPEKKDKNFLVVGTKKLFISRNGYKTEKKYGEIIFDITHKPLIKEIRKYIKGLKDNVVFPFPDEITSDKKQQLSSYLSYYSKKYIKVNLSTTLIAKIMLSHKHLETKIAQEKDSKERGHSVGVQNVVYVKKPLPSEEAETNPKDTSGTK